GPAFVHRELEDAGPGADGVPGVGRIAVEEERAGAVLVAVEHPRAPWLERVGDVDAVLGGGDAGQHEAGEQAGGRAPCASASRARTVVHVVSPLHPRPAHTITADPARA